MSIQTVEITLPNGIAHVVEVRQGPAGANGPNSVTSATTSDGTANLSLASATVTGTLTANHIHGNLAGSIYLHVRAGEALSKGDPVYVSGSHGTGASMVPIVMRADASNAAKMPAIAIMDAAVANNGDGHAVINGTITDLNTQAYAINSTLYVANGGGMTATKPANAQPVARVERSNLNNGGIVVKVNGLYSDVTIASSQVTDATSAATPNTLVKRNEYASATFATQSPAGLGNIDKVIVGVSSDQIPTGDLSILAGTQTPSISEEFDWSLKIDLLSDDRNYSLPDSTGTVILDTTLGAGVNGLSTITGAKSFSGQVQLTGQSATDANSAMTRGLADARYAVTKYSIATADQDVTNSAVKVDSTYLILPLTVGTWEFETFELVGVSALSSGGSASQLAFTGTGSLTGLLFRTTVSQTTPLNNAVTWAGISVAVDANTTNTTGSVMVNRKGRINVTINGNLVVRFAQNTAVAGNYARMLTNSFIRANLIV